jgi:DNA processing protein
MAVPGNPLDARAGGCNQLIRDGATLVRDAADVAEALAASLGAPMLRAAPAAPPETPAPAAPDGPLEARLIELLGPAPVAEDLLIRDLAQPAGTVSALLLDLELAGRILRHPGGLVSLPAA